MSYIPAFITGASVKIKLADKVIAYAQDFSYNVTVANIPIESMSRYEVASNEPVAYFVDGTISIIKYTSEAKGISGANTAGNSLGTIGEFDQFNPAKILESATFEIEVYQRSKVGTGATLTNVVKIHNCRFTRMAGGISKRSVLTEQFAFVGILLDQGEAQVNITGDDQDLT